MTPLHERDYVRAFILAVPKYLPEVLIFERPIVNARATNEKGQQWRVRAGVPGQADAYAVARGGRHVELEMKSARGVLADQQKAWRARCRELGIPHLVLRVGKDEALQDCVQRWIGLLHDECPHFVYRRTLEEEACGTNPIRPHP
jgi:hypothetical protein